MTRFVFERDRFRFAAGRVFLRVLIAAYVGEDPQRLRFAYGARGKPILAWPDTASFGFNLAHSGGLALCAIAPTPDVGVDLERLRALNDAESLARSFFSPRESAEIEEVPERARQKAFFDCWTRKEAFLKATGDGLSGRLDRFDVSFLPGQVPCIRRVQDKPSEAARWSLLAFDPAPGFVAALALPAGQWRLHSWRWSWP